MINKKKKAIPVEKGMMQEIEHFYRTKVPKLRPKNVKEFLDEIFRLRK